MSTLRNIRSIASVGGAPITLSEVFGPLIDRAVEEAADRAVRKLSQVQIAPTKRLHSVRDAALLLDVSHTVLYRCIRAGMPVIRIGSSTKVDIDEAVAWLREHGSEVTR